MPTIFCSPPLSSTTTTVPFRAQEHSPKDNMSSVPASTHSLPLQVSKAFPFCCWRPIRRPTLTTPIRSRRRFGFDRCRRRRCFSATPHPHRVAVILIQMETSLFGIASTKKRRGGETRLIPAAFAFAAGRLHAARGMNPQRFINSSEPFSSSTSLSRLQLFCLAEWRAAGRRGKQSEWERGEERMEGGGEGRERMFRLGVAFFAFREGTW